MPALDLFLHDEFVGTVEPAPRDATRVTLRVDRGYRQSVVLSESFATLPGRRLAPDAVSNFLGGYVPEGNHRERMAAKRHIDKEDLFALLREFGGSIAGAVTLRQSDGRESPMPDYEPLSDHALAGRLKQALTDSDQGIPHDSRSTLPGYQPKVLAARFGDKWVYPHGRAHSTHILKPQVPSRPARIFNEHYSHLLTQHMGLSRYDSQIRTARRIGELLGSIPGGGDAVDTWILQLTYSIAIGNNDAHAKNIALMHSPQGTELAQVYDAIPNLFQVGLVTWNLALSIDGQFDLRRISAERLLAEIDSWGVVRRKNAADIVTQTLTDLDVALRTVAPPSGVSPGVVERLRWNTSRLLAGYEISAPKR